MVPPHVLGTASTQLSIIQLSWFLENVEKSALSNQPLISTQVPEIDRIFEKERRWLVIRCFYDAAPCLSESFGYWL